MTANHNDDTNHILEQIDRAVSDYSVSADAMRSVPADPELPEEPTRVVHHTASSGRPARVLFLPTISDVSAPSLAELRAAGLLASDDERQEALELDLSGLTYSYDPTPDPSDELLDRWWQRVAASRAPGVRHLPDCPSQRLAPVEHIAHPDGSTECRVTITVCEGCA